MSKSYDTTSTTDFVCVYPSDTPGLYDVRVYKQDGTFFVMATNTQAACTRMSNAIESALETWDGWS